MPLLTYFFLGLGWPWVGEFVGFIIMFMFPTQQNLVNGKHPDHGGWGKFEDMNTAVVLPRGASMYIRNTSCLDEEKKDAGIRFDDPATSLASRHTMTNSSSK